jgi:hypothetical protein
MLKYLILRKVSGEGLNAKIATPVHNIAHFFIILTTVESYYAKIQRYCEARRQ